MGWRNRISTIRRLQFDYLGGYCQNEPAEATQPSNEGDSKMLAVVFFIQLSARSRKVNSKAQYIRTEVGEI